MKTNQHKNYTNFSDFLSKERKIASSGESAKAGGFSIFLKPVLRIISVVLLFTVGFASFSGLGTTAASFNDFEQSLGNEFIAGALDFSLETGVSTTSLCLEREPLIKTVKIVNFGNPFKYKPSVSLAGAACDYVWLTANRNGGAPEYTGWLSGFNQGILTYSAPDEWEFILSFASTTPLALGGQICQYTFNFTGSQVKNNLPFPLGFSDWEKASGEIAAPYCAEREVKSMGFWKTHPEIYLPLLPQFLGATGTDEIIDTKAKVNAVFNAPDNVMRNKLKKQLLAMKFNIMYFQIDSFIPDGETRNLDEIVEAADDLLRQDPEPAKEVLEAMKDLLESVNTAGKVYVCACEPPAPDGCALRLTKTANRAEAEPGEEIIYRLTLDNYGRSVCTGGGVRLKDTYDPALKYVSYTVNRTPRGVSFGSNYIEWNFGSIYPNDPLIIVDLKMKVKPAGGCDGVQCGAVVKNTAKFWSNETGWGAPVGVETKIKCESILGWGKIVINEFLPNPVGRDSAPKPNGEWVELYNKGTTAIDVGGWALYDETDTNKLIISTANTDTGGTIIAPGGFLVVYRNGASFALDNTGGDKVRLFNGLITAGAVLIDAYEYTIDAPEGKSFARIPDGSENWVDPIPTPGEENSLEGEEVFFGPAAAEEGEEGYVYIAQTTTDEKISGIDNGVGAISGGESEAGVLDETTTEEAVLPEAAAGEPADKPITQQPADSDGEETLLAQPIALAPEIDLPAPAAVEPAGE